MAFKLPPWATTPTRTSSLIDTNGSVLPTDLKSAYVFGTDPSGCDIYLPLPHYQHFHAAAIVHHTDGRAFLIALSPSPPLAVALDGVPLPLNKPTAMRKGSRISFEGAGAGGVGGEKVIVASFKFDCENSGTKRERGDSGDGAAAAAAAGPSTVRASHLLVKHAGSRRPSSWKEPVVTRSLDEARAIVSAFREGILSSSSSSSAQGAASSASSLSPSTLAAAFASLASVESHCSSARNGGDLGVFRRGQMQRTFEDAAFGLGVGEMSGLVESDSGVHIILRTE